MAETKMQLVDWLDDLCVRFIINLPSEELESVQRICFQIEEAQWFYEDFVRPLDPTLPSLPLKQFCLLMFQHCPIFAQFSEYHHITAFAEFLAYKTRVPVRGAILLNEAMDQVLMVRGWKSGASWSFPRGKINKDEKDIDCAIREVYEETGFDVRAAGLADDEAKVKAIEITLREQHMMLFVFRGVPMDTHFEPRTRKEIGAIQWYKLSELPTFKKKAKQPQHGHENAVLSASKFYMVAPFLVSLKKWIAYQRKLDAKRSNKKSLLHPSSTFEEDPLTADDTDNYATERHDEYAPSVSSAPQSNMIGAYGVAQAPSVDVESTNELKNLLGLGDLQSQSRPPQLLSAEPNPSQLISEQSLQDTQTPVPHNTIDAAHMQHLLQGLRPAGTSEEPSPAIGIANNPHSEKLLALFNKPESTLKTSAPKSNSATLLALFEKAPEPEQDVHAKDVKPPQTPFDQIQFDTKMPPSPRHLHPRPPAFSSMAPPPAFPISHDRRPQSSSPHPKPVPTSGHLPNIQDIASDPRAHAQRPTQSLATLSTGTHSPLVPLNLQEPGREISQDAPWIYRGAGDSEVAQASYDSGLHAPNIPRASNLPAPNLTSHAQNMLKLFKSDEKVASRDDSREFRRSQDASNTKSADGYFPSMPASQLHEMPSSLQQSLHDSIISPLGPSQNPIFKQHMASRVAHEAPATPEFAAVSSTAKSSAHQDSLLRLLQTPSTRSASTVPASMQPIATNSDPVELAAVPSPAVLTQENLLPERRKVEPSQKRNLAPPIDTSKTSSATGQSAPVSATVSGPLVQPDFGTVRRNRKKGSGREDSQVDAHTPNSIQILKRPESSNGVVAPANAKTISPTPTRIPEETKTKPPTPKAFQPTILRRPQPSPKQSSQVSRHSSIEPELYSATADQHKESLLSLFSKPSATSIHNERSSPIISPISGPPGTLPENRNPISVPLTSNTNLPMDLTDDQLGPKSNSIASTPGPQRMNSSSTPISPLDKTFLLGYLTGVVKNAGR